MTLKHPAALDAPSQRDGSLWDLLVQLSASARAGEPVDPSSGWSLDAKGKAQRVALESSWLSSPPKANQAEAELRELLDLYLPLCVGPSSQRFVIGHLGQSVDGRIAASDGSSRYVTGPENMRHMHRLRALCDAVLVGAGTVEHDDPQLTTRLVSGPSPTRVAIDPHRRLGAHHQLFQDESSPTLVICGPANGKQCELPSHVERIELAMAGGILLVEDMISALHARGLRRLFVEGGGVTVSHFLARGRFTRLHITVSPVFLGSGRPGITLPSVKRLDQALRPTAKRYVCGADVLFEFGFEVEGQPVGP